MILRSQHSTIGGGNLNSMDSGSFTLLGGGIRNHVHSSGHAVLAGGSSDTLTRAQGSTIGGGSRNRIRYGFYSGVLSGKFNTIDSSGESVIGGGGFNEILGESNSSGWMTIAGGHTNLIDSSKFGAILGGSRNLLNNADASAILGGRRMTISADGSIGFNGRGVNALTAVEIAESQVAAFMNTDLWIGGNDNTTRQLRLHERSATAGTFPSSTTYFSSFEAGNQTDTIEYILPTAIGTSGDVLEISSVTGQRVTLEWDTDDNSSDLRFKQNVRTLTGALDTVLMLRGVRHDWRRDDFTNRRFPEGESIGFIAQEVEKVVPELVEVESDGYRKVKYAKVTALLVEALREAHEESEKLGSENAELQQRVATLEERLAAIERMLGTAADPTEDNAELSEQTR